MAAPAVVVAVEAAAALSGACRSKLCLARSLYWRLRAGLRRLQSERAPGRWRSRGGRFSFHYDALSYALNFDDGRASADSVR